MRCLRWFRSRIQKSPGTTRRIVADHLNEPEMNVQESSSRVIPLLPRSRKKSKTAEILDRLPRNTPLGIGARKIVV